MTPNAHRILAAATAHRRQRATARWLTHHAALSDRAVEAALRELEAEGLVRVKDREDGMVYEIRDR